MKSGTLDYQEKSSILSNVLNLREESIPRETNDLKLGLTMNITMRILIKKKKKRKNLENFHDLC